MDAHPVPQNVTSFQFRLVGDMTLKQFIYLATGLGIAYILFITVFPIAPVIAVPLISFTALSGIAFAFLPIQDRPLDHWLTAYVKAIMAPTMRFWISPASPYQKADPNDPVFKNKLQIFLNNPQIPTSIVPAQTIYTAPPQKIVPRAPLSRLNIPVPPQPMSEPPKPETQGQPMPSADELKKLVEEAKQAQMLQVKIIDLEKQIEQLKSAASTSPVPQPVYNQQIEQMTENLHTLLGQTSHLQNPVNQNTTPVVNQSLQPQVEAKAPNVVTVTPTKPEKTQPLLTSSPNVINGIISDSAGNYLESVIVIIHNKDNLPVRALKTNKLGQFTGATPLPDGIYTLTLEKENLSFDTIQVTLSGEVMAPITILAKP